jgi:hypothetical protein
MRRDSHRQVDNLTSTVSLIHPSLPKRGPDLTMAVAVRSARSAEALKAITRRTPALRRCDRTDL